MEMEQRISELQMRKWSLCLKALKERQREEGFNSTLHDWDLLTEIDE